MYEYSASTSPASTPSQLSAAPVVRAIPMSHADLRAQWEFARSKGLQEKFKAQLLREAEEEALMAQYFHVRPTRQQHSLDSEPGGVSKGAPCPSPRGPETYVLLKPDELTIAEALCLERIGISGRETPVRSFHAAVLDCLEGKAERQFDPRTHDLLFFARYRARTCTGLVMVLLRKTTCVLKTRGIVYELRRIAALREGEERGSGARLHWNLCRELVDYAHKLGWRSERHEELAIILTLQSCEPRAPYAQPCADPGGPCGLHASAPRLSGTFLSRSPVPQPCTIVCSFSASPLRSLDPRSPPQALGAREDSTREWAGNTTRGRSRSRRKSRSGTWAPSCASTSRMSTLGADTGTSAARRPQPAVTPSLQ
jgi:hypothetical protein